MNRGQSYGEWAEPDDVCAFSVNDFIFPHPEESTAYTCCIMKHMTEIAEHLGKSADADLYRRYAEGCKKAYQELIEKPQFSLDTDRQAKLVRPLEMGLLTDKQRDFAEKRLIKAMDNYGWRLGTGFLSTPFILDVLRKISPEYAYRLPENEECPGWRKESGRLIFEIEIPPNCTADIILPGKESVSVSAEQRIFEI